MKVSFLLLLFTFFSLSASNITFAQDSLKSDNRATQIEQLINKGGMVIVEGFTDIGSVTPMVTGQVTIRAAEYFIPTTNTKMYGIAVNFKNGYPSYIDYDEIDGVLAGLEYLDKITKSVTKLDNVNASFHTRGNLSFYLNTQDNGAINLLVSSGRSAGRFRKSDLPAIRSFIVKAKEKIDSIK